jgi:hypothetical protein
MLSGWTCGVVVWQRRARDSDEGNVLLFPRVDRNKGIGGTRISSVDGGVWRAVHGVNEAGRGVKRVFAGVWR